MMLAEWEDGEIVTSWKLEQRRQKRLDRLALFSFLIFFAAIIAVIAIFILPRGVF